MFRSAKLPRLEHAVAICRASVKKQKQNYLNPLCEIAASTSGKSFIDFRNLISDPSLPFGFSLIHCGGHCTLENLNKFLSHRHCTLENLNKFLSHLKLK